MEVDERSGGKRKLLEDVSETSEKNVGGKRSSKRMRIKKQ